MKKINKSLCPPKFARYIVCFSDALWDSMRNDGLNSGDEVYTARFAYH